LHLIEQRLVQTNRALLFALFFGEVCVQVVAETPCSVTVVRAQAGV
jgi:nucleotide-binding universal stress UspA family protein